MISGAPISAIPLGGVSVPPVTSVSIDADITLVLTLTENTRLFGGLLKDNTVVVTLEENVRVKR